MRESDRLLAASKERAAQRERERYRYHGNDVACKVAQSMWRAFIDDPEMAGWSARKLKARFPDVSHVTAHAIRMWIMSLPRPPGPPIISDATAAKLKRWRKKFSL
jgi:hypothetical protein